MCAVHPLFFPQVEKELGLSVPQAAVTTAKAPDSSTVTAGGVGGPDSSAQIRLVAGPLQAAAGGDVHRVGAAADPFVGGLKQRQQQAAASAAPMGVEDAYSTLSAAVQPLQGH